MSVFPPMDIDPRFAGTHFASGVFSKSAAASITMTPVGPRGAFFCWVQDVKSLLWQLLEIDTALVCNLLVNGAGGLDVGTLDADKVYLAYLISKPKGRDPQLIAARDNVPLVMPPGYTQKTIPAAPIWSDGAGTAILEFGQGASGWFRLKNTFALVAVTGFVGTSPTAVNFTDLLPADPAAPTLTIGADVSLVVMGLNTSSTSRIMSVLHTSTPSGENAVLAYNVSTVAGNISQVTYLVDVLDIYGRLLTEVLHIDWTGAVATGGRIYSAGVRLRGHG